MNFRSERFISRQLLRGVAISGAASWPTDSNLLPLDVEDAIVGLDPEDKTEAPGLAVLTDHELSIQHEQLQTAFDQSVRHYAKDLVLGTLTLLAWHQAMLHALKLYILGQALLGGRGVLSDAKRVDGDVRRDSDYLSRFADELAREGAFRAQAIASRAAMYGGTGRAAFYRERESALPEGYVIDYIPRDDEATCDPCLFAGERGPYLPGAGPFPGTVCLGRSHCRCIRRPRFDLDTWNYLRNRT